MVLFCLPLLGQELPKGKEVLSRVGKTYRRAKSYRVEADVTNRVTGSDAPSVSLPPRDEIDVAFQAPDLLRIERGTNLRTATVFPRGPAPGQYDPDWGPPDDLAMQPTPSPGNLGTVNGQPDPRRLLTQRMRSAGFSDYSAVEQGLSSAETVRQENLSVDGASVACWVVEGTYSGGVHRTFWVDTARNFVLKEAQVSPLKGAPPDSKIEHIITVQKMLWDQPLDDVFTSAVRPLERPSAPGPNGITPPVEVNVCRDAGYTEEARIAHLNGRVMVDFTIDEQGKPAGVHASNHLGLGLDELALDCVSQSRFQPAQKDGHAIAIRSKRTVPFFDRRPANTAWHLAEAVFHPQTGDTRPVFLKAYYPEMFGNFNSRGFAVSLSLTVDAQGIPREVHPAAGADAKAAKEAASIVAKWRFTPGLRDGQPVATAATFLLACGVYQRGATILHR